MPTTKLIQLKHLFYRLNFTLLYYQEIIDRTGIRYDRVRFPRNRPPLTSYRLTSQPLHLRLLKYFSLFYLLRCLAISFFSWSTNSPSKRLLLGTKQWKAEAYYIETNFALWSAIAFLFLQVTLTTSPLDYKFLALYRMTDTPTFFKYTNFGITHSDYIKFAQFRDHALQIYNTINISLLPFAAVCISGLFYQHGLYCTNPWLSIFWTIMTEFYAFMICTILYGNLIAFIVVLKYLYIKQKSFLVKLTFMADLQLRRSSMHQGGGGHIWSRFLILNTKYSHLFDEIKEYNHFWSSYLSFVFVFYVLLISFIIYVILYTALPAYWKVIYSMALTVHISLLSVIIYYCGKIVSLNDQLSQRFYSLTATPTQMSFRPLLKLHHLSATVALNSGSGVVLLNGYLIIFDTFRLLFVNISLYFILFIKD